MKLINTILSWLHKSSNTTIRPVLSTVKTDNKIVKASVDYLFNGKLVTIKSFDNIEDALALYNSMLA